MADAIDVARAILNNWLEERSAQRGEMMPETKPIPTFPSAADQQHFGYTVPNDPLLQMLVRRQMYGGGSGGRT